LKKPEHIIKQIEDPICGELVTLIVAGMGIIKLDDRPEWAKRAAKEFWRCAVDLPKQKTAKSENYRLGFLLGMVKGHGKIDFGSEVKLEALNKDDRLIKFAQTKILDEPPADAADFHAGFADGLKRGDKISPANPWLIYLKIALHWRMVLEFKNVTGLHSWLDEILGANLAGSRVRIATICHRIGLRFPDKGGRPKLKPPSPSRI
jgi:hypothetical protein